MMKMAKASQADLDMAMKLCSALESLERGYMPPDARLPDEEDDEDFDSEDSEHCYRALKEVLRIVRIGSIGRVVWGMAVLLDPENKVVDPDADTLEDHPDTVAEKKDAERYRWLRQGRYEEDLPSVQSLSTGCIGCTLDGDDLDVAIDDAISGKRPSPEL